MPRPRKQKIICSLPRCRAFAPFDGTGAGEAVVLNVEEFETIRLIDHEGLDQAQCAEEMGVARSTVQRLYNDARCKIAQCLVDGRALEISGGDYVLCQGQKDQSLFCGKRCRHKCRFEYGVNETAIEKEHP